jgi:hypothetical protein
MESNWIINRPAAPIYDSPVPNAKVGTMVPSFNLMVCTLDMVGVKGVRPCHMRSIPLYMLPAPTTIGCSHLRKRTSTITVYP